MQDKKQKSQARLEQRRTELLDAAAALFVAEGFDGTSVDMICRRAGVAKGTFYLYFRSKQEALEALKSRFLAGAEGEINRRIAALRPDDWTGRLDAWLRCWVQAYLDNVALHNAIFHASALRHADPEREAHVVGPVAELLRQGAQAGAWTAENPYWLAQFLFYGLHGSIDMAMTLDPVPDLESLFLQLRGLCFCTLGMGAGEKE